MSEPKYRVMTMGGYHGKSRVRQERQRAAEMMRLLRRVWRPRTPLQELADHGAVGRHAHRVEWVAECNCASDGSHYQGYKCLDCGEKFGDRWPVTRNSQQDAE